MLEECEYVPIGVSSAPQNERIQYRAILINFKMNNLQDSSTWDSQTLSCWSFKQIFGSKLKVLFAHN